MDEVELQIQGQWIRFEVKDCDESVRGLSARCPQCKQPATFCCGPEKGPYYRSDLHLPTCGIPKGGKVFHIEDGYDIRLNDVLAAKDSPYLPPGIEPDGPKSGPTPNPDLEGISVDNFTVIGPIAARTCSTIYKIVKKMDLKANITPDITREKFLVDEETIAYHRLNGLNGVHMMIGVRFNLRAMDPPLPRKEEYIYLRDPYSWNRKDAIYYRLRCEEPTQHEYFAKTILSSENPSRFIIFIGKVKLRKIFSDEEYRNNLKTDKTRHKKLRFSYSDEILFTYSVRDKDGSSVINVNPYIIDPKGKRIPLPELNTEKAPLTINDPEVWLGTFFAHKVKKKKGGSRISIRGEISERLKEVYSGHPVTMKTFIYVHTEIERDYSDEKISLVRTLMESSLSEMYPRDITARHIKAYLEEYDGCRQMMLTVLTDIFNIAMKSGHLHRDPAAEISSSLADRYKELDEVRTALTKQFLSVSEIRSLTVKCLTQAPDDPLYLAVLLRIFTGLSPSVICTIRYGDIRKAVFRGTDFQILSLERRLSSSGNVFTPLSRPEQIRDIPLPESVTALIKQRETMLRIKYPGITDDQVGRMQIFDGGDIRIDASTSILSPSKISNLTRTLLRSLDIKSNTLHIPHNKYGIEDTDLSRYGGDLIRSTYRHYLVRETDLNEGEINYLLGIIPLSIYRSYLEWRK